MTTEIRHDADTSDHPPNGAAMAAFLAAGIGAVAMGVFVILSEAGALTAPSIYAPSGGISGRTTFAAAVWLVAWGLLHLLWKRRQLSPEPILVITIALIALGVLACFPPVWQLL